MRRLVTTSACFGLDAFSDRVVDRDGAKHGGRRGDSGHHRERRSRDGEDRERYQPEQARPGEMPERLALEQDLREQEQRRAAEREDAEAERGIVAGMGDRELVADGDPDQCEDYQRQRPRAPVPDGASAPQATISPRSSAAP